MTRALKQDFVVLEKFIKDYNLSNLSENTDFLLQLSPMHKKYYSIITFVHELDNSKDDSGKDVFSTKQRQFLFETISDIGNSFFLCINGAYKPSKLMLRSSIETFLKGLFIKDIANLDKEKRIYKMFEDIKQLSSMNDTSNTKEYDKLRTYYSILSQDTHTASLQHMQHISSLNFFPSFSIDLIKDISKYFCELITIYHYFLATFFNKSFNKIHFLNKDIIIKSINKSYRKRIQNI